MPPEPIPVRNPPVLPLLTIETESVQHELLNSLRSALPEERIDLLGNFSAQQLARTDVCISANPAPEMFEQLPNLVWVQSMWAGVDNMLDAAKRYELKLARLVDPQLTEAMAEAALAWTLYLHRRMPEYALSQRNRSWQQLSYKTASQRTVSVLGLGELGAASAKRLAANGFNVSGWSSSEKSLRGINCYSGKEGLNRMLSATDILVILLPLTPTTHRLVNQQLLKLLPATSSLINFARGAVVDTEDLLSALDQGQLQHAVLDVFDEEPLPVESHLWQHPRVTVLPHISALTDPGSSAQIAANNINTYRHSGDLPVTVDLVKGF